MAQWIASLLLIVGAIVIGSSVLGVVRLPDVYLRTKAQSVLSTTGAACVAAALALVLPAQHALRVLLVLVVLLLTGPVVHHLIMLLAHEDGAPGVHRHDELAEQRERRHGGAKH